MVRPVKGNIHRQTLTGQGWNTSFIDVVVSKDTLRFVCFHDIQRGSLFDISQSYIRPSKMVLYFIFYSFLRKSQCLPFKVQC